jgi:hypothetical protein
MPSRKDPLNAPVGHVAHPLGLSSLARLQFSNRNIFGVQLS